MKTPSTPDVPSAGALVEWFGAWPTFHDAEILALHLNRDGVSSLRIHTWLLTNETYEQDGRRFYRTDKHAVVTFDLEEIVDLELSDFSGQNVISALYVERQADSIRLTLSPCYGLAGHIEARRMSVAVKPWQDDQRTPSRESP